MNVAIRPLPTKLAAAVLTAGVVSVGSIAALPPDRALSAETADVANASVITDALYRFGDVVSGIASGVTIPAQAASSLPFEVASVIAIASQNPSLGPSLLSWLVQDYLNPSDAYPLITWPYLFKVDAIEEVAGVLPFGDLIVNATNQLADAINDALSGLPNSAGGDAAVSYFWNETDIGRTVLAANLLVLAPTWALFDTVSYLGYLPGDLEATFESAIQQPGDIPGLISNLVYGLLSSGGLLGNVITDFTAPFTVLPGPIGELASNLQNAIYDGLDNVLSLLPPPISPTPFPSGVPAEPEAVDDGSVNTLRQVSVDEDVNADSLEGDAQTTEPAPQDSGPISDELEPVVDADEPVTNELRSGNKVEPGDKFSDQVQGGSVAADDVEESVTPDTETPEADATTPDVQGDGPADEGAPESNDPGTSGDAAA
ncbi:hypothetical protein ACFQWH_10675 [Mycolicibacterium sp. GCM10028919]|uniref:hypothetical protein n=1 Tax=Mycolicibacterium sp. GCM10028919 TaxID=3273401 RepID=UPI003611E1CB